MVSVVVPVYNMENFLHRCMNTLVNQSAEYEIILVDDGSTDSSSEICDNYMQKYPSLVRVIHKSNGGLSSARNVGMDAAQGIYVIFPDPDDWVEPDYISQMVELQKYYQPDLLCVGYYVDTDGKCVPANEGQKLNCMDRAEAQQALFIPPKMGGFAWNKLYHLDRIREHKLRFLDNVGTTEDLDFAFRYLSYCETVCFVPDTRLYHYFQRRGAATHSKFSVKKIETIRTYEKIIESSGDDKLVQAAKEEICNTAINLIWQYQNSNLQDKDVLKKVQRYVSDYLRIYLKSEQYGKRRKLQAIMACYMPALYALLKKCVIKDGE